MTAIIGVLIVVALLVAIFGRGNVAKFARGILMFMLFLVCWSVYENGGPAGQWVGGIGALIIFVVVGKSMFRKQNKQLAEQDLQDLQSRNLIADQLIKLATLHDSKMLSDDEFEQQKARLTKELNKPRRRKTFMENLTT